ncbi:efflux RND transporter permease subunit [Desulforamulus hydrothermalis]|uniref:Acriflavin resistance protein n=1 Tax=Desulforamulus hydrothermalis Lam5 = DSM 18033 TaxID=1121428 RepID=K8EFQ7_9FIRM|nr:efflux RND transporter permease subunit [Desulforamulus hydrothermalis]CCO07526.1 Acriflavin resistance protein [Desulforamulus hydrothermalis Lam5 = DSM 18033]SHH30644.1 hydrophobic/amphiphilic exporter-1, HAE1 family [Desulforamulus hydrothermalis Lam5 = DSM 18033]
MKIADFSVDRPVAISMLIIALIFLGLFSLPRLAVDLYPEMELPIAVIVTSYEGAAPAEVEKLVTKPIEAAVATTGNIKEIRSRSQNGISLVIVQFNWGTNMDNAAIELREKIDYVKGALPGEVKTPRVMKLDPNQAPILSFSMTGSDVVKLKKIAEDTVQSRLERIDGVASVSISGGKSREIKVILDPAKMETYGLSVNQVMQALAGDNISGTAGVVERGTQETAIRVTGEYTSLAQIKQIRVPLPGQGGSLALGDLAAVEDSFKKESRFAYVDGQPSLGLDVMKSTGANTVQVAKEVLQEVAALNKTLPDGVKITTVVDMSKFIQQSIDNVIYHGLVGGILAVIILYLFLRSLRSTLVVALVMPISIIATFTLMYFGHQTINMLSLGGLALGLGSLVDFSVVVLESIYRYRQQGYDVIQAAKLGTAEVANAVTASAGAQVVVFLPIVFVEGLAGILFKPMALTVSFSHIAALFAALTLVPMMSSRLLQKVAPPDENLPPGRTKNPVLLFGRFMHRLNLHYGSLLRWALGNRKKVVGFTALLLLLSVAATPLIGTEFIPTMDQGEITVKIDMPAGTKVAETARVAADLEKLARSQVKEIERIFTTVGSGGQLSFLGVGSGDQATLQIKLKPLAQRDISTEQAVEKLRRAVQDIPGADITVSLADNSGSPSSKPVDIAIRGDDLTVLNQLGDLLAEVVKSVPGTRNVTNSLSEATPEVQIMVDREQAARYGLSAGQVLAAVSTSFDGRVVSRMRTGEDEVDVRLLFPEDSSKDADALANLTLVAPTGARVPVSAVARITTQHAPTEIIRSSQSREVRITADISGRDTGSVNKEIAAALNKLALPEGYTIHTGGQAKDMADSFKSLAIALILSVVLVFMVMAAQFESLFQPFIIMFSLPPTFIGVVLGLGITGHHLSVPALIGAIMLIGIVVNNAIVLVDYINTLRKRGYERDQAVLAAGPVRLRPILMTALTTVLALLPLAFGGGEGSEGQAPMAVVVAFGLTLSTLITLVLVPVVYTVFDDLGRKLSAKWAKVKLPRLKSIGT